MLADAARWTAVAVVLVATAVALHALFPAVRGHVAMGLAAALLVLAAYSLGRERD